MRSRWSKLLRSRWFAVLATCMYVAVLVLSDILHTHAFAVFTYVGCAMYVAGMTGRALYTDKAGGLWLALTCSFGAAFAASGISTIIMMYAVGYQQFSPSFNIFFITLFCLLPVLWVWSRRSHLSEKQTKTEINEERRGHGPEHVSGSYAAVQCADVDSGQASAG